MAAVSRINKAAYALEKASMALLQASTPSGKEVARRQFEAARAEMLALLVPATTKLHEAA